MPTHQDLQRLADAVDLDGDNDNLDWGRFPHCNPDRTDACTHHIWSLAVFVGEQPFLCTFAEEFECDDPPVDFRGEGFSTTDAQKALALALELSGVSSPEVSVTAADTRTVYVTKYALTRGIFSTEVRPGKGWQWHEGHFVYSRGQQFRLGYDAFFTEKEARAKACALRDKKILSLRKQIRKLEALDFR